MKHLLLSALAAATLLPLSAKAPKDPVLMTVDGVPVTLSEFEYLYHKNHGQQIDRQSLDEYLDMFTIYKLKVAEARRQRVDTIQAFQQEFNGYRAELVAPYLRDSLTEKQLVKEAYDHMKESVEVDHLMVPLEKKALIDSLRQALVNGADFTATAQKYSTDPSIRSNNGYYGWINAGQFPYEWEEGVYNTPVGEISDVITTRYGHHLAKVRNRRPNPGEVHARHILLTYPNERTDEANAAVKQRIDSIYGALQAGADFADVSKRLSDCPSGAQGGDLGWFGTHRMVPEFEAVSFALADGEISKPFTTQFGWHIVERMGHRGIAPFEQMEASIRAKMAQDGRSNRAVETKIAQLKKAYPSKVLQSGLDRINQAVAAAADFDSAIESLAHDTTPLITVADSTVTIADFMNPRPRIAPGSDPSTALSAMADERLNEVVLTYEDHRLEKKHPELRNIVNEYRDGMMLFEVSNQKVWNAAANDYAALNEYFKTHRDKYTDWSEPRFKGYVIYATSDSLIQEVNKFIAANPSIETDSIGPVLRGAFPRNIKIERVLLPKGKNNVVDYAGFGAELPDLSGERRWKYFTTYQGRVIDQPEEAADARGAVTADYQSELEKKWVEELRKRYPVKINKKILKKVKPLQ